MMKSSFLPVVFLVVSLSVSADEPPAASDDPAVFKQRIVVTASAVEESVEATPASVTVITREEIETRGARDLADVLRDVPGVSLSRYGSPGKAASLFVRGGSSQQTLVLWNGIEINNPYFAGYDWGQFSTSGIERVEIVRGPYSALYGSDAMSGVVNVITEGATPGMAVDVAFGERGLSEGRVGGAGTIGGWSLSGDAEHREDRGWFGNDDLRQTSITVGARWTSDVGLSAGLFGRWNDYDLGIPFNEVFGIDYLVPSLARRQSGNELQIALPIEGRLGKAKWNATLSQAGHDITLTDPDDPFGLTFQSTRSVSRRVHAGVTIATSAGTIVVGGEVERSKVDDDSSYGVNLSGETRDSRSMFLEDRFSRVAGRGRLEVSIGGRWDAFDTFGSEVSPRVAAAWITGPNKIRGAWGSAFRAPSIGELYFPFAGNPDLEAEKSKSWEIGYERRTDRGRASITWFRSSFDDLIFYDNEAYVFENIGAATTRGVELSAEAWSGTGWRAGMSYTWLDAKRDDTGDALVRRPRNSGSVQLGWSGTATTATLVVVRTGERADIAPVFPYDRITTDAWTTVSVRVERRAGSISPWIRVENLLDERYEDVAGFPSPGRRATVGLRYSH